MVTEVLWGVLLPFFGTSLGAACVFFLHKLPGDGLQRVLLGFAAGVMAAASVWSLLIPAIDRAAPLGTWAFLPAAVGLWLGVLLLYRMDKKAPESSRTHTLTLAVTLHNVPEGMAVGAAYAGCLAAGGDLAPALTLALAIGIQNVPEGAVISLPLRAEGRPKPRAFAAGVLSGAVEPLGAALTIAAAQLIVPAARAASVHSCAHSAGRVGFGYPVSFYADVCPTGLCVHRLHWIDGLIFNSHSL